MHPAVLRDMAAEILIGVLQLTGIMTLRGVKDGLKKDIQRLPWIIINRFLLRLICLVYSPDIRIGRQQTWLRESPSLLLHPMPPVDIWKLTFSLCNVRTG